jgi:putative IMPACT (imprinted ancient) family translation regulator
VYAYGIITPEGQAYTRHSDDSEPQGTAGLPVLNVFLKNKIQRFVCVVTRYFGGTLLGAGGLVRAYSAAAKLACDAAGVAPLIRYTSYEITVPYPDWDKFSYEMKKGGLAMDRTEFTDKCAAFVTVPETLEEVFQKIIENRDAKIIGG